MRAVAAAVALLMPVGMAAALEIPDGLAAAYAELDVSPPNRDRVIVCHGFGCKFRSTVALGAADHKALAGIMSSGRGSPEAERNAVAQAGLWFDRRLGAAVGTVNHVAKANWRHAGDPRQFDCIDTSRNLTSLLLIIDDLGLLRHHRVAAPQARGMLFDGRPPHATAVLSERSGGGRFSVDAWTRAYGHAPEVMPLERWMERND
jgi:hypothetical protein